MKNLIEFGLNRAMRKFGARAASRVIAMVEGPSPAKFVRSRYGVEMRANWRDRTFQYSYFATYGRALSDLLGRKPQPFIFLDVGANQGLYALIAARNPSCVKAVALEPVAATFALLEENIAANGAGDKIHAIPAALSRRSGRSTISVKKNHSGAASLVDFGIGDLGEAETVMLIRGGELTESLAGSREIVVKIDVEGHEATVIEELLASRYAPRISTIFYEVDEKWSDPDKLATRLSEAGFRTFRKLGMGHHYDMLATR